MVIKHVHGHGGREVFLLSKNDRESFNHASVLFGKDCIVQERIKSRSEDIRVYLVGNKIYHAVRRTGKEDFRSNYSLGGKAESYVLSASEQEIVENVLKILKNNRIFLGFAGLDFIPSEDGRWFFNELEEMVGCRMLYEHTKKDIVNDFMAWLKQNGKW